MALLICGIAFVPLVHRCDFLDPLRYSASLVFSWPVRYAAELMRDESAADAQPTIDTGAEDPPALRGPDRVPVVERNPKRRWLIVAVGFQDGVRRGAVVSSAGRLIGFVDGLRSHLARVRLVDAPASRFGVVVGTEPDVEQVLVRGDGPGTAVPASGSLMPSAVGARVRLAGVPGPAAGLEVGRIRHDAKQGGRILAIDDLLVDRVTIHDLRSGIPLRPPELPLFRSAEGRILLEGDISDVGVSRLISLGGRDGIEQGSWVSQGGLIIGRIERTGTRCARVRGLEEHDDFPGGLLPEGVRGARVGDSFRADRGLRVHTFQHARELAELSGRRRG